MIVTHPTLPTTSVAPAALLQTSVGDNVPLHGVDARGTVRGLLFELEVEQRYRNGGNTNIEAVYTFPLPSDAVLLGLDVELDGRKLTAAVVEKKSAEENYEKALDKGDSAIMLERGADGLLTMNLGNLMAGEKAVIRYRYAQLLRFEHGSVRIAIPTVIAPRYGDPVAAGLAPHQVPVTALDATYPFTLAIALEGAVAQRYHRVAVAPDHHVPHRPGRLAIAAARWLPRPRLRAQHRRPRRAILGRGRAGRRPLRRLRQLLRGGAGTEGDAAAAAQAAGRLLRLDDRRQHRRRQACAAPHPGEPDTDRSLRVVPVRQSGSSGATGAMHRRRRRDPGDLNAHRADGRRPRRHRDDGSAAGHVRNRRAG